MEMPDLNAIVRLLSFGRAYLLEVQHVDERSKTTKCAIHVKLKVLKVN